MYKCGEFLHNVAAISDVVDVAATADVLLLLLLLLMSFMLLWLFLMLPLLLSFYFGHFRNFFGHFSWIICNSQIEPLELQQPFKLMQATNSTATDLH